MGHGSFCRLSEACALRDGSHSRGRLAGHLRDIRMQQWCFLRPDSSPLRTDRGDQLDAGGQPAPALLLEHFAADRQFSRYNEKLQPARVRDADGFTWLPILETYFFMTIVEQNC